jgi:hypothetical protein
MHNTSTTKRNWLLSLFAGGALAVALPSQGQIVSLNITRDGPGSQWIGAGTNYGIASLGTVTDGWVNLQQPTNAYNNVNFASGTASTVDAVVPSFSGGAWSVGNSVYTNTPLMSWLNDSAVGGATPTFTVSDINASFPAGYFVVAYFSGFLNCTGASVSDGTDTFYFRPLNSGNIGSFNGTLTETTQTTDLGANNNPFAQYAVFGSAATPRTADSLTFTVKMLSGTGGAGLGGLQIVAVPEPAALPLLSLGFGLLALRLAQRRG